MAITRIANHPLAALQRLPSQFKRDLITPLVPNYITATTEIVRAEIGVTLLTSGTSSTDGTSVSTASVEPAADSLILACVISAIEAGQTVTPTCSGNGLTWTEVGNVTYGSGDRARITLFRAIGTSPSAGAITFDFGEESQTSFTWHVVQCTNVDQATQVVQFDTNQAATGTTVTTTLAALENENNVNVAFAGGRGVGAWTADAQFTELSDRQASSDNQTTTSQWAVNETDCTAQNANGFGMAAISVEVKSGVAA